MSDRSGAVKIKLCGLRRAEDIAAANRCLPDYIGFVLAPSRRRVNPDTARELKHMLDPRIRAVGVFVNEAPETVAALCQEGVIDLAQLHGEEDEAYIARLNSLTDRPVIKALRVGDTLPSLPASADFLLFDAYHPQERGGTGLAFDWSLLRGVEQPYFLAGGLNAGNLTHALSLCAPYCVDVSSGIETGGVKDSGKMERIVAMLRSPG